MRMQLLVFGSALVLLGGGVCAQDKDDHLAIIVGKNSPLDNVTGAELAKIFRAEKGRGLDGQKYVLVSREPGSLERVAALKSIYQMDEGEYGIFFLQATFTGAVQAAPKQITTGTAMRQFVASTPGAIGYARGSEVDDTVKVVNVDGKAPGDADYRLKMK